MVIAYLRAGNLLAVAQLRRCQGRGAALRGLVTFERDCGPTSKNKLAARVCLIGLNRAANRVRIKVVARALSVNRYLSIQNPWPPFYALSICRIFDLAHRHFYVEFSNARAGRDSDARRAGILQIIIRHARGADRLHALLQSLALHLVILKLKTILHEFLSLNLLGRLCAGLAHARRLVLAATRMMRLREIQNELVSHLLLLGQLGGGVGRLDAIVHVATVGFAVLLRILRNVLCVGDIHLRLQGQAFL